MAAGQRILLVESDPTARADLASALGSLGHTVRCAATGQEGLDELRTHRPDLILLDLGTVTGDGREFCRTRRRDPVLAEIPLVMISAAPSDDPERDLPGDETQLCKPLDPAQLLAALGRRRPPE
jgi:CheY-like chemotaxis protein